MKKTIVLAILGIAAGVVSSQGQATVNFSNYYSGTAPTINYQGSGIPVGSEFQAELYFVVGAGASDATVMANPFPASLVHFGNSYPAYPAADGDTVNGAGWFLGSGLDLGGTAQETISAEVVAFNGTDYASSAIKGKSGVFTLVTGGGLVLPASLQGAMPNFTVIPEPTTMALGGLGLAALMLYRRKQV